MTHRFLPSSLRLLPLVLAVFLLAPAAAPAQTDVPRTADGRPDPSGVWNFSTATPMQRPEELAGKERLTVEEAAEYEALLAERRRAGDSRLSRGQLLDGQLADRRGGRAAGGERRAVGRLRARLLL